MDRSILDEILEEAEAEEATYFTAYGQREVNGSYYYQHGYNPLSEGSRSRGKSFETFGL